MSKRVVVIDDMPEIVDIVKVALKTKGYEVLSAHSGQDGLDLIYRERPDLVIVDLMLPHISGMEIIKRLRRDPAMKDIPVLAMSAIARHSDKPEEFWRQGLGADDFIAKPFDPVALLGRVEYVLRKREYVSAGASSNGVKTEAPSTPRINLAEATPKQVVKAFIEAWNTQDFETEYNCLAEEMTGGIGLREYVGRRRQIYADENGSQKKQACEQILESSQSRNAAKVVCLRTETRGHITKRMEESYVLRKTSNGWKIVAVRSRPITEVKTNG
ncbi:MAG: response regulator [Candidatus Sumerlaeia bacterium]|nr:response regulator [Candidatus Sumerlaeia bacterium]